MFIIENYGFFIFLTVIILIIFYFQNGQCFDLRKNIREGFNNSKERFSNMKDGSSMNISDINYLGSQSRMDDYLELQKKIKRYELPFNKFNDGYVLNQLETPLVPLNSYHPLTFPPPYGHRKDYCNYLFFFICKSYQL